MISVATAVARQREGMQSVGARRMNESYAQLTVHPGQLAAARADAWIAGVQRSKPKWVKNVAGKHSLPELQNRMATKGVQNYNSSIPTANAAYQKNGGPFIQQAQTIAQGLPPRGDIGQNLQRATQQAQKMHDFAVSQIGS